MKILSFVIPAYNSGAFLDKCITSMLVPEILDKLEIIVVNDGSKDSTEAIAKSYCRKYPQTVRLISQENKGHGGALNTGLAAASGKYLKVVDADDWVETVNLPTFIGLLERCDSDIVLTHHRTIDISTGEIKNWRNYPSEFGKAYSFQQVVSCWKNFERSMTFHGITYRRDFYRDHAGALPEHVFYEDHEYATFPCCYGHSVMCFDLFLYDYRIGDVSQSVSSVNQLKRIGHLETVIKRMVAQYNALPQGPGRQYAGIKIAGVLLSYFTTVLLVNPERRQGREQARGMMNYCKDNAASVHTLTEQKYLILYLMNILGFDKNAWDKMLNSKFYSKIRKKYSFA